MENGFDKVQAINTPEVQAKIAEHDKEAQLLRDRHVRAYQDSIANLLEKHLHVKTESGSLNFEWVQQLAVVSLSEYIRIQRVKIDELGAYIKQNNSSAAFGSRFPESENMYRTFTRTLDAALTKVEGATDLSSLSEALIEVPEDNLGYYGWTSDNPQIKQQESESPLYTLKKYVIELNNLMNQQKD